MDPKYIAQLTELCDAKSLERLELATRFRDELLVKLTKEEIAFLDRLDHIIRMTSQSISDDWD